MVVRRCTIGSQPDTGQQGSVITEVVASGGVLVSAGKDLPGLDAEESVVQALAAESEIDLAMIAARRVEFAVGVAQTEREQAGGPAFCAVRSW